MTARREGFKARVWETRIDGRAVRGPNLTCHPDKDNQQQARYQRETLGLASS